ncbi:hypothetical protein D3C85_1441600 [compost metagenome]
MGMVKVDAVGEHFVGTTQPQPLPRMFGDHLQACHQDLRTIGNATGQHQRLEKPESQHRDGQCRHGNDPAATITAPDGHGEQRQKQRQRRTTALAKHYK